MAEDYGIAAFHCVPISTPHTTTNHNSRKHMILTSTVKHTVNLASAPVLLHQPQGNPNTAPVKAAEVHKHLKLSRRETFFSNQRRHGPKKILLLKGEYEKPDSALCHPA